MVDFDHNLDIVIITDRNDQIALESEERYPNGGLFCNYWNSLLTLLANTFDGIENINNIEFSISGTTVTLNIWADAEKTDLIATADFEQTGGGSTGPQISLNNANHLSFAFDDDRIATIFSPNITSSAEIYLDFQGTDSQTSFENQGTYVLSGAFQGGAELSSAVTLYGETALKALNGSLTTPAFSLAGTPSFNYDLEWEIETAFYFTTKDLNANPFYAVFGDHADNFTNGAVMTQIVDGVNKLVCYIYTQSGQPSTNFTFDLDYANTNINTWYRVKLRRELVDSGTHTYQMTAWKAEGTNEYVQIQQENTTLLLSSSSADLYIGNSSYLSGSAGSIMGYVQFFKRKYLL